MRAATIVALAVSLWCGLAVAQDAAFVDPTRPPNAVPDSDATAPAGPRLQSVLISPHRREAVISGQTVALGGKYGDAIVIRISEGEVALRQGREIQTLTLLPEAKKVRRTHALRRPERGGRK